MKTTRLVLLCGFILCVFLANHTFATKIVSWNICNFPSKALGIGKDAITSVIASLDFDMLVVQEMESHAGVEIFLKEVIQATSKGKKFKAAPFFDGPDTDNAVYYNRKKYKFLSSLQIPTKNRDISEYTFRIRRGKEKGTVFHVFSVNFTEGNTSRAKKRRKKEALTLRNHLNTLGPNSFYVICGTFNLSSGTEESYKILLDTMDKNFGYVVDPAVYDAAWHGKKKYAYFHTQSTRKNALTSGYEGGGLDDRFDAIFASPTFNIGEYFVYGNDGKHLNRSVDWPLNNSIPYNVARALHNASDHLPVCIDIEALKDEYIDQCQIGIDYGYWFERDEVRWQEFIPKVDNISSVELYLGVQGKAGNVIVEIRDLNNYVLGQKIIPEAEMSYWGEYKVIFDQSIGVVPGEKYRIYLYADEESLSPDNRYHWRGSWIFPYLKRCKNDIHSRYVPGYVFAFKTYAKR